VPNLTHLIAGGVLAIGLAGAANAALPVYPSSGTENPVTYTFTAAADGDLVAYFAGSTAGYSEDLGLLVNGVDTGLYGLPNHTTPVGTSFNFGPVSAGDELVFFIRVFTIATTWYSDKALNSDGANHVWSTAYGGGDFGIPAGTYVAFEDLPKGGSNNNYFDETFVFTNVRTSVPGIPEPATWAMMIIGFAGIGAVLRNGRSTACAT